MLNLPDLAQNATYYWNSIEQYANKEDWGLINLQFPLNNLPDMKNFKNKKPWMLEYKILPIMQYRRQIDEFAIAFDKSPEHIRKIEKIKDLLMACHAVFPVFIYKNDPCSKICEGMHRAVAIRSLGSDVLPAFLIKFEGQ